MLESPLTSVLKNSISENISTYYVGAFWLISSSRWLISFTHTFALSLYTVVLRCTHALMKKWLHSYQDQDFFIEFLGYISVSPLNPHVFSFYMSKIFWTLQIDLVRGPSKTIGTWPKLFGDSPKLFWYHVDSRSKMKILHTYSINYRFLFWPHFVTNWVQILANIYFSSNKLSGS